jgi:glycosyltransferase involved in cell wall biosynthesis
VKNFVVIIPTYNPKKSIFELLNFFINQNTFLILVIDDGTKKHLKKNISIINNSKIKYLKNDKNYGKGYSLKKGLKFIISKNLNLKKINILHCDDDYQHSYKSILNIVKYSYSIKADNYLILGKRKIDKSAPFFSKIGNKIINKIFNIFFKINNTDTQNGLRVYPSYLSKIFLECETNRFEFESEMLIIASKKNIKILSLPIEVLYEKKHYSRFNKNYDSYLFFKFLILFFLKNKK